VYDVCSLATDQPLLEPLLFPSSQPDDGSADKLQPLAVECLLCDKVFMEDEKSDNINEHLLTSHNLIIGEPLEIADLTKYAVHVSYSDIDKSVI